MRTRLYLKPISSPEQSLPLSSGTEKRTGKGNGGSGGEIVSVVCSAHACTVAVVVLLIILASCTRKVFIF